ncbi:MAG: hypothetical protein COB67_00980 [SAR324 cluster bacterium]|uniref:Uncharacterized protein n=1 Tax=SAR324 cluster bacterium TaxID=2024889 RepID=A0A2A4TC94_9DELT|nr:MAG: hypothetical protein COB67_00980 [SAR324 cluster bacterium]
MKRKSLIIFLCVFWSAVVQAQVATPSIDPALPTELPSAGSWRFGSVIAADTLFGERESDVEKVKLHPLGVSALVAWQPSQVTVELYMAPETLQDDVDSSTDTFSESKQLKSYLSLSIRGENRVSVGVTVRQLENKSTTKTTEKSFGGSVSVRVFGGLFIAAGLERVSSVRSGLDTLRWGKNLAGISLQLGDPFSKMLRLEASLRTSPEVKESTTSAIRHQKTADMQIAAEALFSGILLSYLNRSLVEGTGIGEVTVESQRIGAGYRGDNLTFMFYQYSGTETIGEKSYNEKKYQATFSLSFM